MGNITEHLSKLGDFDIYARDVNNKIHLISQLTGCRHKDAVNKGHKLFQDRKNKCPSMKYMTYFVRPANQT